MSVPTEADAQRALATIDTHFPGINIPITDNDQKDAAAELLREIKSVQKELDERKKEITKPLDAARKALLALFKPKEDELSQAEASLRRNILTYSQAQEAARAKLEAQLRDEHRRQQEEIEAQARELEEAGNNEQAEVMRIVAAVPPTIILAKDKTEGISKRTTWKAEVTNLRELVEAVADGRADIEFLQADMSSLNAAAKAQRGAALIPGVRIYEEVGLVVRT